MSGWLVESWRDLWQIPVSAFAMLTVVILSVRLIGLRSFSKMSSFDFAVTVSIGSILGGVVATSVPIFEGATAVASLLGAQAAVSWLRSRRSGIEKALDNTPVLLMDGSTMLEDSMLAARVTRSDILAKMREANVLRLQDVRAVVLETTGDISVLHGEHRLDDAIVSGVRRTQTHD